MLEKNFKVVPQDSELGILGLKFLFKGGPYNSDRDLSDEKVWVEIKDEEFIVLFYNISSRVDEGSNYYKSFRNYFKKEGLI